MENDKSKDDEIETKEYKPVYCKKCKQSLQNRTMFMICDNVFCSITCRNSVYTVDERGARLIKKKESLTDLNKLNN